MSLKSSAAALELSTGCDCPSADVLVRAVIKVGHTVGIVVIRYELNRYRTGNVYCQMYPVTCKYNVTYLMYLILNVIFQLISRTSNFRTYIGMNIFLPFDVTNYHYKLRNVPEESRSHLLRGGSLKSRMTQSVPTYFRYTLYTKKR